MKPSTILFLALFSVAHAEIAHSTGRSMLPAIPERAVLSFEVVPFADLKKGDIVVYYSEKLRYNVAHRLFKRMSKTEWWARGDHNRWPDVDYVTPQNFIGRVTNIKPESY